MGASGSQLPLCGSIVTVCADCQRNATLNAIALGSIFLTKWWYQSALSLSRTLLISSSRSGTNGDNHPHLVGNANLYPEHITRTPPWRETAFSNEQRNGNNDRWRSIWRERQTTWNSLGQALCVTVEAPQNSFIVSISLVADLMGFAGRKVSPH